MRPFLETGDRRSLTTIVSSAPPCSAHRLPSSDSSSGGPLHSPDLPALACLIQQCGIHKSLSCGRLLHAHLLIHTPHGRSAYLLSLLVQMYGHCAALEDARRVFGDIRTKNACSWNIMIGIHVKQQAVSEAILLFRRMQLEGVVPDEYSMVGSISAHASLHNLLEGKRLHASFAWTEMEENAVVGTALINLYGRSGCIEPAEAVFKKLTNWDIVVCNAMIALYAQQGQDHEAHQLYNNVHQEGFMPNKVTFLGVLDSCKGHEGLLMGKMLHVHIVHAGLASDVFVLTTLISMYGKCWSPETSVSLFDEMRERNTITWNSVIAVHAHHMDNENVLQLLNQMQQESLVPDRITFRTVLCSISDRSNVVNTKLLHAHVVCCGFDSDVVVATALFGMFGKYGNLEYARNIFDGMLKKDLIAWNAMITLYAQHEDATAVVQLLEEMQQARVTPDKVTLVSSLSACASISLELAQLLFNNIYQRDVTVWNAMLGACAEHGHSTHAFELFQQMLREGLNPDKVTLLTLLSMCANTVAVAEGKLVHNFVLYSHFDLHGPIVCGLVHMYNKFGDIDSACLIFQHACERDVILFNAMITALIEHDQDYKALLLWARIHNEAQVPDEVTFVGTLDACATVGTLQKGKHMHSCIMNSECKSGEVVVTALFNMYRNCGSFQEAQSVFGSIMQHDAISWTAVITAFAECNDNSVVLQLFQQMQIEGVSIDNGVYVNILSACADEADLMQGKAIHTQIINNNIQTDVSLGNALVNMYGKCGSMMDAQREFQKLPDQDVLSFNVMIAGYAQHGYGNEALKLYDGMLEQKKSPNEYTFGSILTACSHVGYVDEGYMCVRAILEENALVALEHFDCMVDILGRTGRLQEAEALLVDMPMQPTHLSWMTLLGASRNQIDIGRGEIVSQHIFELDGGDASPYIALSNLYAAIVG